jgi:hypothetical protein
LHTTRCLEDKEGERRLTVIHQRREDTEPDDRLASYFGFLDLGEWTFRSR